MIKILPTASMYAQSISNSFGLTRTLPEISPCLDYDGQPISFCGAWAVVFKVRFVDSEIYGDHEYALKCYLRKGNNPKENSEFISTLDSDYIVGFEYFDKELCVYDDYDNMSYFSVSVMKWVDGETLAHLITRLCRPVNRKGDFDPAYMAMLKQLAHNFDRFALWLLAQPFAHGDLKGDNILVDWDFNIKVIDNDNIYIPDSDQSSQMVFYAEFAHPMRTSQSRGLWLDDYSLVLISLSLHALVERPELYAQLNNGENIIFSPSDIFAKGSAQDHVLDSLRTFWELENKPIFVAMIDALRGDSAKIYGVGDLFACLSV